jgi:hypothetical protein
MGYKVNAMSWTLYPHEKDLVPIVWESGWAKESVWMGMKKSWPHRGLNPGPFSLKQFNTLTTPSWLLYIAGLMIYTANSMKWEQMCQAAFITTKHDITWN